MIGIRVKQYGEAPRMRAMLEGLRRAATDFRAAAPKIVAAFRKQEARLWDTEGGSGEHGHWIALKPSYALRKAKLFAQRPILYLSGALRDSLAGESEGTLVVYFPNALFIGTSLPYARFLAEGKPPLMGARRAIDPTDRDVYEWLMILVRHVEQESFKVGWKGRFQQAMGA